MRLLKRTNMLSLFNHAQLLFSDFTALFFPNLCMACMEDAPVRNDFFCVSCTYKLPRTNFHLHKENSFTDRLWGRIPIETAASMFLLIKGGLAENVIYNIKYKDAKELAQKLGREYGRVLKKSPLYSSVEIIVPVPIHHSKLKTRGYNQSALFANGLAESLEIPVAENALAKVRKSTSQTKKTRLQRLLSVEDEYVVNEPESMLGKHVLLVDDVLTTGATIESCALEIFKLADTKVSLGTIAFKEQ